MNRSLDDSPAGPLDISSIDEKCRAGEEFVKVYYQLMDSSRHKLIQLYTEETNVVWNGNGSRGLADVRRFFESLPPSQHKAVTIDVHNLLENDLLITVTGTVKFPERTEQAFHQVFTVKRPHLRDSRTHAFIASDSFRFVDGTF